MQAARGASLNGDDTQPASSADGVPHPRRRLRLFAGVAALAYAADVISKVVAVELLSDRPPVTVIPGVLDLMLVRNSGAAFSIATGLTAVLTVIAVAVCVVVIRVARRLRNPTWAVALGLMLGGALGNLTDRFLRDPGPMRGHVVDFLALPNWPVFNLADSCVCVAAALIVIQSFRGIGLDGSRHDSAGEEPAGPDEDS